VAQGLSYCGGFYPKTDVNGDGRVNAADVILLLQKVAKTE
jgi:hypothetical protein